MNQSVYKNYFLRTLIGALSVSALIGIYIFLAGDFGNTEMRLLITTISITGFNLTGMSCSSIYNKKRLKEFSVIGMLVAVLGCLMTVAAVWEIVDSDGFWKTVTIFSIGSFTLAHISLLFLVNHKTDIVKRCRIITIAFIIIVALMLIIITLNELDVSNFFYRLLGVFAILDVLGTIATPIINKIAE